MASGTQRAGRRPGRGGKTTLLNCLASAVPARERIVTWAAWVSQAEVAEVPFTAFSSKNADQRVTGRLVVRRIPDLNPRRRDGQDALFDTWCFHAFFTTTDPDDLKNSALAHLASGKFTANAAWLVLAVIAFNLTRTAATLTGQPQPATATTATIRRKLITVPARVASSARRIVLHVPAAWPWESPWTQLFTHSCGPPTPVTTT